MSIELSPVSRSVVPDTSAETSAISVLIQNALLSPSATEPTISKLQFFEYIKRQEEIERARMNATLANISQLLFDSNDAPAPMSPSSAAHGLSRSPSLDFEVKIEEVRPPPVVTNSKASTFTATPSTKPQTSFSQRPPPLPSSSHHAATANGSRRPMFHSGFRQEKHSSSKGGAVYSSRNESLPHDGKHTKPSSLCPGVQVLKLICGECESPVAGELELKVHLLKKHKIHQPYRCLHQNCQHSSMNKPLLGHHVKTVHNGKLSCRDCLKKYKMPTSLAKHYAMEHQTGYYQCSRCRKVRIILKDAIDHWKKCLKPKKTSLLHQQQHQKPNFVKQAKPPMKLRSHHATLGR